MFLTVKQAAHYLGLELHQVYYLINMGEIEAVKIRGVWRLVYCAVLAYAEDWRRKNGSVTYWNRAGSI